MSRIGKSIIKLPPKVEVKQESDFIEVKGPKGNLKCPMYQNIEMHKDGDVIRFERKDEEKNTLALHGLARTLLYNCVKGVSEGWEKNLEIFGVGYRAQKKGDTLVLSLGYSHEVSFKEPPGVSINVIDQLKIKIAGADKQMVGQVAADIRSLKLPEPYKGKGIKYSDERIIRKAGKTGKK
ncbi:MAG: 50S ribosomal protein L6 [Leptospiraceae bacterium]|nr:50S ribosomal protein L6 [Leptospiraceae bacterium]MCP5496654.1 50S ribosomal protein L6 [Leptospiraceae bacterium]